MHLHEDKQKIQNKREFSVVNSNSTLFFPLIANTVRVKPIQNTKILNTYGSIPTVDSPHDESIDFRASAPIGIAETKNVIKTAVDDTDSKPLEKSDGSLNFLKNLKLTNVNRIIIGQLNKNSLRNKFDSLHAIIMRNLDILVITETKLDESFSSSQFTLEGYQMPLRLDRNSDGGGIIVYIREGIPCRKIKSHNPFGDLEGVFFEINLRKNKWLFFGGYKPKKENIVNFLTNVSSTLEHFLTKYDNLFLMGDFNSETNEKDMADFCETYNLSNLVKDPTCYKKHSNPSSIDLLLTNRTRNY